ncbi:hypothetical protein GLOIN_2v1709556 [Rhizophagus clarus]|uniref:Uncharacterized protein n=1 Tax=Rhizophagus clarus TaxID=94130 RepID=A0A8H3QYR5_9GLOM|nr:hypothetical protein GLOIN_2v1709556 [Rhizophagus clarus]
MADVSDVDAGVAPNQKPELNYYRNLWWRNGEFSSKAKWEEVSLPYLLIINAVDYTNSRIVNLGATRTRADDSGKETDSSFRPKKARVPAPAGSDGESEPWPNLVIEVAYSETIDHVFKKVREYWCPDLSRVHDVIVVKIDPVPDGEIPSRMQAWHFCANDRRTRNSQLEARTHFEFGTQDGANPPNQLNIVPGMRLINISLNCLYHEAYTGVQIPATLPSPIVLDFYQVLDEFLFTYRV